ncbi:hypothetical protein Ancab_036164 [Ancistrocladus abbreviatus]
MLLDREQGTVDSLRSLLKGTSLSKGTANGWIWKHEKNSIYTTRSAYELIRHKQAVSNLELMLAPTALNAFFPIWFFLVLYLMRCRNCCCAFRCFAGNSIDLLGELVEWYLADKGLYEGQGEAVGREEVLGRLDQEDFFGELLGMLSEMPEVTELHRVPDTHVPVMKFKVNGVSIVLLYA